jgi:hypothetical protein
VKPAVVGTLVGPVNQKQTTFQFILSIFRYILHIDYEKCNQTWVGSRPIDKYHRIEFPYKASSCALMYKRQRPYLLYMLWWGKYEYIWPPPHRFPY